MTDKIQKRKPEILAPAGSIESVRAAVNAGLGREPMQITHRETICGR